MSIKSAIPWWGKIAAKIALSRLPIGYQIWNRLGLFVHGSMERPEYTYEVFKTHFERVKPQEKFVYLEIGPGDSLSSAVVSWAFGASASYLVDVGEFAQKDVKIYQAMADFLNQTGRSAPDLQNLESVAEVLDRCHAQYLTSGLASLRTIGDRSVDFIVSHAVLEHVSRAEFLDTMKELRRIIRDDGVCSHTVDLRDHLSNALNNLRFSKSVWESDLMSRSGFYTNRIQYSQMLELFRQAGFDVEVTEVERWDELPIKRAKLAPEFQHWSDEELRVSVFSVILRPTHS